MTQPGNINSILKSAPGYDWVVGKLREHDLLIRQSQTARSGNAMTIDGKPGVTLVNGGGLEVDNGGGITINDGGAMIMVTPAGRTVLQVKQIGIPDGSGRTQQAFILARDDGTVAFYVADLGVVPGHPHQQSWAFVDRSGNVIFAEDTVSGFGISTPYFMAGVWVDISVPGSASNGATTTSGTYTGMQWAVSCQQHPMIWASVLVQTPAGTTGQIRMTVGGAQVGSAVTVPAASFGEFIIGPAAWPGTPVFGQSVTLQLEAKRTAGTGAVGVRGMALWGIQS